MANTKWRFRDVQFQSEGATLRGRLYTPKGISRPFHGGDSAECSRIPSEARGAPPERLR